MRYCIDLTTDLYSHKEFHKCLHKVESLDVKYVIHDHVFMFYNRIDRTLAKLTVFSGQEYNEFEFKMSKYESKYEYEYKLSFIPDSVIEGIKKELTNLELEFTHRQTGRYNSMQLVNGYKFNIFIFNSEEDLVFANLTVFIGYTF